MSLVTNALFIVFQWYFAFSFLFFSMYGCAPPRTFISNLFFNVVSFIWNKRPKKGGHTAQAGGCAKKAHTEQRFFFLYHA